MEAALSGRSSILRQDSVDIFIEPDGLVPDYEDFLQRVANTPAPLVADQAPRLN
ncbi:hypothetical protein [Mesorhizobium sp.]|uniref:hypothetical protein n=1 Tax=Mesorhizobium sp. TaxID=1871066 RepID=UPI0025BEE1A7|nr:hypothetical protein [Mesorhizobium sp.]